MSAGTVQCTLNAIGACAGDNYTALPGETVMFELFLQNNSTEECEYGVEIQPPIAVPVENIGEPKYTYFNGGSGTVEDCLVLPCGACVSVVWEMTLPDPLCGAVTLCARLTKKTDDTQIIVKKDLKKGTAQVEVPVKPEIKTLVSQTIAVGVQSEDLKTCPNSNGYRSNDGTAVMQWFTGAWDDCLGALFADACDNGLSLIDVIKACVAGTPIDPAALPPLSIQLSKTDIGEAIQGVDLDEDGDVGEVTVEAGEEPPPEPPVEGKEAELSLENESREGLREIAAGLDLPTSGTKSQLIQRIELARVAGGDA